MTEWMQNSDPILLGILAGCIGSFLRESALLYSAIEKGKITKKVKILFVFLPLWVICGGLLGAVVSYNGQVPPLYTVLIGAVWRKVITDGKLAIKILRNVLDIIETQQGDENKP